ncbi:MAG: SAM-dependent methyltransferase [Clostridia bacterium]|nr:SAM-dependent methyltransferase [Clostridia bacterium]
MKLSPRLAMVADLVREGVTVADIGTDHAYLPAYLVSSGKCPAAVGSDLRDGPLMNAAATVALWGVADEVRLLESDGLDALSADDADDFVFAGMGGTLIVELLSRTPWLCDRAKRYIFQPMSHGELVRAFLLQNGFRILDERACFDECRPYVAFSAAYEPEYRPQYRKSYIWMGELPRRLNEAASYYLTKQYIYLKQRADALERAALLPDEVRVIREILPDLEPYIRRKNKGEI